MNIPHPIRPLTAKEDPEHTRNWGWRWYAWYDDEFIKKEQELQKRTVIRVWHSGFALQAIRRDVVEQIKFQTDAVVNNLEAWECAGTDVIYSNSLALSGIPIFADPRIKMLHLRHSGSLEITLGNPFLKFYPAPGNKSPEQKERWEEYEPIYTSPKP